MIYNAFEALKAFYRTTVVPLHFGKHRTFNLHTLPALLLIPYLIGGHRSTIQAERTPPPPPFSTLFAITKNTPVRGDRFDHKFRNLLGTEKPDSPKRIGLFRTPRRAKF